MKIDINKDFEKAFPDECWKGFTLKQIITFVIALLIALGVIVGLWYFAGIEPITGSYIAIPIMMPICFLGIFEYQNHSLWKMGEEIKFYKKTKRLAYEAEEASGTKKIFFLYHHSKGKKRKNEHKKEKLKIF